MEETGFEKLRQGALNGLFHHGEIFPHFGLAVATTLNVGKFGAFDPLHDQHAARAEFR